MASIVPEASYYNAGRKGKPHDIFLNTTPNYDSYAESFKFYEGDEIITGFKPENEGLSLLVDIFTFNAATNTWDPYGFSLCPLLTQLNTDADQDTNEFYVQSGYFVLPVYTGRVKQALVD